MDFDRLAWVFAAAVTLHNSEEALFLPAWSQNAGRWHAPVGAVEFRFAVAVLTGLAFGAAALANAGGSFGAYLLAGYALAMALNVVAPHLVACLVMRRYAPGTATAILFVLPASLAVLRAGFAEGRIAWDRFLWAGPLTAAGILAAIPALFALGRAFSRPPVAGPKQKV